MSGSRSDSLAAARWPMTIIFPSCLRFGDVQALAVCEVDRTRREHAKQRVDKAYEGKTPSQVCAAYSDFRELVGRKDIDAVCIATPEHWHAIPAIEAMKAGKDVYCEKPLTLTLAEGKRCIEVARKYERVFQTGSQQRSNVFGPFREAAELIRSGRLGKIQTVTVGVGGPSKWCDLPAEKMEPGLDWDLWLGPAPKRPYNSHLSPRGVHKHFPAGGATIANMPAVDMPTWARIIMTSCNGAWAWMNPARWRSCRPWFRTPITA